MSATLASFFFLGKHEIQWYCHGAMRFFRAVQALAVSAAAFVLGSCQTTTPAERIEQNPLLFRQLSPEQKMMVQQGKICEGMTKDAVSALWKVTYFGSVIVMLLPSSA